MKKAVAVLVAVVGLLFMTGCSTVNTPPDMVALHYSGGSFSSQKFDSCVPTSTRQNTNSPGDHYYYYPNNQRNYDATGGKNSDAAPITVVSKDNADMSIPIIVTFDLDTNCKTLQKFHETLGNRDHAYWENDHSSEIPEGWRLMLNKVVGKALDTTLDREAKQFDWRVLRQSTDARLQLQQAVKRELPGLARVAQGGNDFLKNWDVTVLSPDPTDPALKASVAAEQANIAAANAARAKADADVATAKAQKALAEAEAAKKRAEIAGYGGFENYNKNQAVEKGLNPYQPTYIVNGTQPTK